MCVIIALPPKAKMNYDHFFNSVHNNWHSYGVILKDGNGALQVIKDCPEKHNDPEVIWKILEDNDDCERIVHLRHTTKGGTNLMNTQPFSVYKSDKREIYFMHNGTLYTFGTNMSGSNDKSDTLEFCEKILQPALLRWRGENGDADYNDPEFRRLILDKQWNSNSKGLFVSNFAPNLYYGDGWKDYKQTDETLPVIKVSNNDYFERVIRGPLFEQRREEERMRTIQNSTATNSGGTTRGVDNKATTFRIKEFSEPDIKKSAEIIELLDSLFDDENNAKLISKISFMDMYTLQHFIETNHSMFVASVISTIADRLKDTVDENDELRNRNDRLHIAMQKLREEYGLDKKVA